MKGFVLVAVASVFFVIGCQSENTDEYSRLLAKERDAKLAEVEQRARDDADDALRLANLAKEAAERAAAEEAARAEAEKADQVVIKPAVPELPEFGWEITRRFNLPLNNPAVVPASEALFLEPDDSVCGILIGDHARAYPWFVLANYHAVNDQIGDVPVIVNLCEACNGGSAFLASVADTTLDFRPYGLKNGTWYATDFQTGSLWYPFIGTAFEGPLKGTKLQRVRMYFSTWRQWADDHPQTTVIVSSDEMRVRPHGRESHMADGQIFSPMLLRRIISKAPNPKRGLIPPYELVFGLVPSSKDETATAYRLSHLQDTKELILTESAGKPVVLFLQNEHQIGAYVCQYDDQDLQIELVSSDPVVMKDQHGNVWDQWGRSQKGPNHPAELSVADGYLAKWYEWIENFPKSNLVGKE